MAINLKKTPEAGAIAKDPNYVPTGIPEAIVKGVTDFACTLYHKYPNWYGTAATGFDAPIKNFKYALMNGICGKPPAQSQPYQPTFTGGQCHILYVVTYQFTAAHGGGPYIYKPQVWGPITGIRVTTAGNSTSIEIGGHTETSPAQPKWIGVYGDSSTSPSRPANASILEVTPLYGNQPDNCGNLAPSSPPTPSLQEINITKTFNIEGQDVIIDFSGIKPGTNFGIDIPVKINGEDANIGLGLDGINLGKELEDLGEQGQQLADAISDLQNQLDELQAKQEECCQTPEAGTLDYVTVTLTKIPTDADMQFGGQSSPSVIYAGWFEFQKGSHSYPREPIHFKDNIFKAPPRANGYAYTLYTGFEGVHTEYTIQPSGS